MATRSKKAAAPAAGPTVDEARAALIAVLGVTAANALLGAAQVAVKESRAVQVIVNTGDATKYGAVTIGKATPKGFIPGVGIKAQDLRFVAAELLAAADTVDPLPQG